MSCYGATSVAGDVPAAVLGWAEFIAITDQLGQTISADGSPDVVVGILRGGMIPAVRLSHLLGLRDVRALNVTHTTADGVNAAKTSRPLVHNSSSLGDVTGLDLLLVDDVAGTGETISVCRSILEAAGARNVRIAACALNKANWRQSVDRDPGDVLTYLGVAYQGWVVFPWETR
jgi:uncharacterized protein